MLGESSLFSRVNLVLPFLVFLFIAVAHPPASRAQSQDRGEEDTAPDSTEGRRIFTARCASCHGLDGHGAERAPSLVGEKVRRLSDAEISGIISRGVPGTGMPAFRSLSESEVHAIVSYVRNLQGQGRGQPKTAVKLPGDPGRGRTIFFGKAECSSCHTVRGEGGFLGPDLSTYASAIPVKELIEAITSPRRKSDSSSRMALAVTRNGQRISGLVRNEDNFSVQLQTQDGAFHFFLRSDLQSLEYQDRPLMPTNYGERLSRDELKDLASYLVATGQSEKPAHAVTHKGKP